MVSGCTVPCCPWASRTLWWIRRASPWIAELGGRRRTAWTREKLLRHLIRFQEDPDEWRVVRVRSVEDEDEPHLHRELSRLKRERTQHTNLIKSISLAAPGTDSQGTWHR